MNKPEYDSKDDMHVIDSKPYETQAISHVKNFISDTLDQEAEVDDDPDDLDLGASPVPNSIELADKIVNTLLRAGILIPTSLTDETIAAALREERLQ